MFSQCSRTDLETFLEKPRTACLADAPDPDRLVGGPVCGNRFVERGEQCDCGPPEVQSPAPPRPLLSAHVRGPCPFLPHGHPACSQPHLFPDSERGFRGHGGA